MFPLIIQQRMTYRVHLIKKLLQNRSTCEKVSPFKQIDSKFQNLVDLHILTTVQYRFCF